MKTLFECGFEATSSGPLLVPRESSEQIVLNGHCIHSYVPRPKSLLIPGKLDVTPNTGMKKAIYPDGLRFDCTKKN